MAGQVKSARDIDDDSIIEQLKPETMREGSLVRERFDNSGTIDLFSNSPTCMNDGSWHHFVIRLDTRPRHRKVIVGVPISMAT